MKAIKYVVAGLIAAGITASSQAIITVNFNALNNTFVTDNTGAANYLDGDLIEVGTFATPPINVTAGNVLSVLSGFSVFGTTLSSSGEISGSANGTAGATFGHQQIYMVVYNAATTGAANQYGIFDVSDASNSAWKFPADADTLTSTTIEAADMFSDTAATLAAGATIVYGGKGVDGSGPYNLLETAPVPEPSSYALVGMGLLGAIGLIRRRK